MFSVCEISELIKNKKISVKEITTHYLNKIEENKELNSFITICHEKALEKAQKLDNQKEKTGALFGIPYACKDNICTKGVRTTCASNMLKDFVPFYNAHVIDKLSQSVLLGKTNMDEFGMGSFCKNSCFGETKNPHNKSKTSGGSSGGSAAAVTSGQAAFALGSDTGGSVRLPAALCGCVGFKPSYGAISRYGLISFASSLDCIGILSNNVSDAEKVFLNVLGKDAKDMTSKNVSPAKTLKKLNIGIPKEYLENCEKAIEEQLFIVAHKLEKAGHNIETCSLKTTEYIVPSYRIISSAEASSNLARFDGIRFGLCKEGRTWEETLIKTRSQGFGTEVKSRMLLGNFVLKAENYNEYYEKAVLARNKIRIDFKQAFEKYDFLLTPTTHRTASDIEKYPESFSEMCLGGANLAYLPAISLNAGFYNQMPFGIQLIGAENADFDLLYAGKQLEELCNEL